MEQNRIPLCEPEIRGNEWRYLKECLDTNWVSSAGPFTERFEYMVAQYVGARYAVATVSGTAALHIALLVAGVQPDEEVLVSDLTFIASANVIRYVGAWPVVVDAEPAYWQMDPQKLASFLEEGCEWHSGGLYNRRTARRVRAILPVHILGHPADMDPLLELAHRYDLRVIEDATEGLGAQYKGRPVGTLGDIGCFSFNGNKLITTGGGGMVVTNREEWARRARYLTTQAKDDPVEFIHGEIGYNYRLSNLHAAVGCAQMEQIGDYISIKREIASHYEKALRGVPGITLMAQAPWAISVWWMYTVLVDETLFGISSRALLQRLHEGGIQSRPLWQPLHLSPVYHGAQATDCSVSERLYRDALSLPCSVGLKEEQQRRVVEVLHASAARGVPRR